MLISPDEVAEAGPYDVVLELVGAPSLELALRSLAVGAHVVVIGVGAGATASVSLLGLMSRRATLRGSTLRARSREVSLDQGWDSEEGDELEQLQFKPDGHFQQQPSDWGNPEQSFTSRQFFEVLEACADKLPANLGRVFLMREWLELSTEDICKEMALSSTNLYVQLHRARLRLRECLELNWFGNKGVKS